MYQMQQDEHSNMPARKENPALGGRSAADEQTADLLRSSLRELLHEYKMVLAPGAYYLIGKFEEDRVTDIVEHHVPFPGSPARDEEYVTFAFFEKGYPPADLAQKGFQYWQEQFPFSHDVSSTSHEFQDVLISHIKIKLLRMYG